MQQYMRGVVVTAPGKVEVVDDIPVPVPGPYEALVKIRSCGFCNGTDMHIIHNTLTRDEGMKDLPTLLGHEACGEVIELGPKCRNIEPGDQYIRPHLHSAGKYTLTYGNFTEYALALDHEAMFADGYGIRDIPFYSTGYMGVGPAMGKIPRFIDPVDGGVMLSLCECYSALRDFGVGAGASVLVYGSGPMGLAMMTIMRALEVGRVVAVDGVPARLERAKTTAKVGMTINFNETAVEDALAGEKFDFVIDAVGSTDIHEKGSWNLRPGGKVCGLGVLPAGRDLVNMHKVQNNTMIHIHSQPYLRFSVIGAVSELIRAGRLDPRDFYSHVLTMDEMDECLRLVASKEALKVVIRI